jgi:hypothetical protein
MTRRMRNLHRNGNPLICRVGAVFDVLDDDDPLEGRHVFDFWSST